MTAPTTFQPPFVVWAKGRPRTPEFGDHADALLYMNRLLHRYGVTSLVTDSTGAVCGETWQREAS